MMGPSVAAVGDGFVYVSNRASNEVCVVDDRSLKVGSCVPLSSAPDVIAYVPSAKEVWVTVPKESSLVVFDASKLDTLNLKLAFTANVLFWATYVLTRPLGATLGDTLTKPTADGGLNLGRISSTLAIGAAMIAIIAMTSLRKRDRLSPKAL